MNSHSRNDAPGRGLFIVLEGGDGCGKTTQAAALCRRLAAERGRRCLSEREPDSRDIVGAVVRSAYYGSVKILPETLAYMHVADRLEHVAFMQPHLDAGDDIVCDRYYPSNMAYNRTPRLSMEQIYELNRPCFETLDPDLIIYLEVSPEVSARRRAAGRTEEEIFDADETQRRVLKNYREALDYLAARGRRVVTVNADLTEAEVSDAIWTAVVALINDKKQ